MLNSPRKFYEGLIAAGTVFQSCLLLAIRLYWGGSFFWGGWAKLTHIEPVVEFFTSLGIPFPALNAYLVGGVECIGGLCLLIGFGSRLVAIPLAITMLVALLTVNYAVVANAFEDPLLLTQQTPFNYLFAALLVFAFGPGNISLDYLLERRFKPKKVDLLP